jgi:hypothetical protein
MNPAAIILLAVTATKICIIPRYLKVSSTGSGKGKSVPLRARGAQRVPGS